MPTFTSIRTSIPWGPGFPAGWNTGNYEGSPYFSVTNCSLNFDLLVLPYCRLGPAAGGPCFATYFAKATDLDHPQ